MGFLAGCGFETALLSVSDDVPDSSLQARGGIQAGNLANTGFPGLSRRLCFVGWAPGNIVRAEAFGRDEIFFPMLISNIPSYVKLHPYSWEILLLLLILVLATLKKEALSVGQPGFL